MFYTFIRIPEKILTGRAREVDTALAFLRVAISQIFPWIN